MLNVARANTREIELQCLLHELSPDIAVLTETELLVADDTFLVLNAVLLPEIRLGKYRLLLLIKEQLISRYSSTIILSSPVDIWVKLRTPQGMLAIGAVYRQ